MARPIDRARWADAIEAIVEAPPKETMKETAEKAGVSERTIYRWLKKDDFQQMLKKETDRRLNHWIPKIDQAMLDECLKGSVGAAQQLYQRAGRTVQVTRNEELDKFMEKIPEKEATELEYFLKNGVFPDEDDLVHEQPERTQ